MGDEGEIHVLRASNGRLEHELNILKLSNHRLDKELQNVREQYESQRQLVQSLKRMRQTELKVMREDEAKKFECAIKDLKTRLAIEKSQSLEEQRIQLERNFRSELIKLVHQKDGQLHLLFSHSQRVKREADKKSMAERQHYQDTYQKNVDKLKQDFQKQLSRLLLELKTKERHVESLEKTILYVSNSNRSLKNSLTCSSSSTKMMTTTISPSHGNGKKQDQDSRPVSRNNKSFIRGKRKHPYSGKRRYESPTTTMKEMGEQPQPELFFYHHNYTGGSALETLPEAESEEECSETEDVSEIVNPLANSCSSSQGSDDNFCLSHGTSLDNLPPDGPPPPPPTSIVCYESNDDQRHKIVSLETTIRQLRDELRECKDQNELLEFRLLEIEEIGENSQSGCEVRKCGKSTRGVRGLLASSDGALYHGTEVEVSTDVTIRGDYDSSSNNSHASVAESRSSCSDCSDSLSLQESGIFDSQSDDMGTSSATGYANGMSPKEDISRELAHLTSQIESLVIRFAEGGSNTQTSSTTNMTNNGGASDGGGGGNEDGQASSRAVVGASSPSLPGSAGSSSGGMRLKGKKGQDLTTELKSCRQRILEFERRLTQFADFNYANSLEDKVALLIQENQRLEEERCELEEAENDSRHQCQRLEDKMMQLRQKKAFLQRQLSSEKLFIEQLRMKILQLQEREEDLSSQIIRVDALECRNFELEESCIEMNSSIQFVVHSFPILILWYLWSILKALESFQNLKQQQKSLYQNDGVEQVKTKLIHTFPFPALPPCPSSIPPEIIPRKHKLMNHNNNMNNNNNTGSFIESAEPSLKKLRGVEKKETLIPIHDDDSEGLHNIEPPPFLHLHHSTLTLTPLQSLSSPQKIDVAVETNGEEWKKLIDNIISVQYQEWQKVEQVLRQKIELLECDMDKHENVFNLERGKIIQHFENKLGEQSNNALQQSQKILQERRALQDKWESLVSDLENFVHTFASQNNIKNSFGNDAIIKSVQDSQGVDPSSIKKIDQPMDTTKIKSGGLVANRIRSLFPGEWKPNRETPEIVSTVCTPMCTTTPIINNKTIVDIKCNQKEKNEWVLRLEQAFQEQLLKFEHREKLLLNEIEKLKKEMETKSTIKLNVKSTMDASCSTDDDDNVVIIKEQDNSQIVYLSQENNRLQIILSDQESALSKVKELEEENEKLMIELTDNNLLRKRLEDAHGAENILRNRIEELEQSEINTKENIEQVLRRERKCLERISQLREEIQFLRNKCCQLQDDLDLKITREDKYKNEIQLLASKVKGLMIELEEKEILLENDSSSAQSQISKLRSQLNDVHKQMADVECSNGMLREEVLYLERTLQEAMERASCLEKTVGSLTGELGQREGTIETLQKELETWNGPQSPTIMQENLVVASNDLDIFAQNEGGLFGVDRDIKRIASQIQSCCRESCKSSSKKLTEVSEQLNTLTMMLGGGSPMDRVINGDSTGFPERLSRCESDECLSRSMGVNTMTKVAKRDCKDDMTPVKEVNEVISAKSEDEVDEEDGQIKCLKSKVSQLEERQKELRESHLTENSWYNARCRQKNRLILVLSRRIAHVSVTDKEGIFLDTIINEIGQLERERDLWPPTIYQLDTSQMPRDPQQVNLNELDFTCESLCLFLNYERNRIMRIVESAFQEGGMESPLDGTDFIEELEQELEFKICRKIAEDALLVSWTIPDKYSMEKVDGYEISVNGHIFLRIRDSQRYKVVLFGLDLSQPCHLSLKCTGATLQESTLTYIA